MIDVQQRPLGPFEQNPLVGFDGIEQIGRRIGT